MSEATELLKRPLYAFDIPAEILSTLQLKSSSVDGIISPLEEVAATAPTSSSPRAEHIPSQVDRVEQASSCTLCSASFPTFTEQRLHARSDWHGYNLKQSLRYRPSVSERDFEHLVDNLEESISGSEFSSEEDQDSGNVSQLAAVLKRQARISHDEAGSEEEVPQRKKKKLGAGAAPLIWFSSKALASNISLGVYKAIFTDVELQSQDLLKSLRDKQLQPTKAQTSAQLGVADQQSSTISSPNVFMCMIGGGHFAGMVVSLSPRIGKTSNGIEDRQTVVVAHKTFHRYTTRRKQGGAQSSNDAAKGAAHSAGAGIRRHNEMALEAEVRALLREWKSLIENCELLFVRATGTSNRRTLFGPYDGQVLTQKDTRNRTFPFSTRRATQAELMRAFVEVTRVKVSEVDEAALAAIAAEEAKKVINPKPVTAPTKPLGSKPSKEEEAALLHTSQLQALIRRSKVPAVLSYLASNSLSPDFVFHPPSTQANHHASTPLHLAASSNSPVMVLSLLTKAGSNPEFLNGEGKPAFDVAGDRQTRDAFRVARSELGESRWSWDEAHCPSALTRAEADKREQAEKVEATKAEAARRKAETERLEKEAQSNPVPRNKPGKTLGVAETTAADQREHESRGLNPDMRARLERERRARAAEDRIRKMTGR